MVVKIQRNPDHNPCQLRTFQRTLALTDAEANFGEHISFHVLLPKNMVEGDIRERGEDVLNRLNPIAKCRNLK